MAWEVTKLDPDQIEDVVVTTDLVYVKRVDFVPPASAGADEICYKGWATPGTVPSVASWRIARLTINMQGDVTEEWADGNSNFDNIWDDRGSLIYA